MNNQFPITRPATRQHGYILPLVLVFLVILMFNSASFFYRTADSTKLSGSSRDYDQALLLAESGANYVMGRFSNTTTTTATIAPCAAARMVGDINCDGSIDGAQAKPASFNPTLPLTLGYEFFLTTGSNAITQNAPGILQLVADGEARNTGTVATQAISTGTTRLRVNDLFVSASIRPLLYTQSSTGLAYSANTWSAESSAEKVAVWIEVTKNPDATKANWFDIYLCSAAQIGNGKAYLQRFMGSYTDLFGAAAIAPISESANHG